MELSIGYFLFSFIFFCSVYFNIVYCVSVISERGGMAFVIILGVFCWKWLVFYGFFFGGLLVFYGYFLLLFVNGNYVYFYVFFLRVDMYVLLWYFFYFFV